MLSRILTCLAVLVAAAPAPALSRSKGVRVIERRAERDGPTVLVVGGIHGNEPAPPHAVRALATVELERGRLLLVPEANRAALAENSRHTPGAKFLDLNRNFPIAERRSARGRLARELWRVAEREAPDLVVDVHEGFDFNRKNPKSVGNSVTYVPNARTGAETGRMARQLLHTINRTLADRSKHFTLLAPGPKGSYARSVTEELGIASLVLETTRAGQPLELRVRQHRLLLEEILVLTGLTAEASRPGR